MRRRNRDSIIGTALALIIVFSGLLFRDATDTITGYMALVLMFIFLGAVTYFLVIDIYKKIKGLFKGSSK